jgi:16S rRNA U516 pseudouridylate synthase RsuA-like enzyme
LDFHYYLFYKPFRVLCQFSPEGGKQTPEGRGEQPALVEFVDRLTPG